MGKVRQSGERRDETRGLVRTSALLGGAALVSRVLGLVRDMCMAWLLGGGMVADALVVALRLPHVVRRLLGEGSLSMTLTASLVHLECERGRDAAGYMRSLAKALSLRLGVIFFSLALLGTFAAPWLVGFLAPGFSGEQLERTSELLCLSLPYIPCAVMAALGMAFLHSLGVFWLPAFSPVLFNLVMLGFAAVAVLGSLPPAVALATGMTCGGVAQWLIQWLAVRRLLSTIPEKPVTDRVKDGNFASDAWACVRRLPSGILGTAAPQLAMLLAMALASGMEQGQVAALYYAERLLELPLGLVGVCLGMASLPKLSRFVVQGEMGLFEEHLSTALRLTLLFILPAVTGLWAVGPNLVEGLLCHGSFDGSATLETGRALLAYLPALPALALNRPLLAACNALNMESRTAIISAIAATCTFVAGCVLLSGCFSITGVMLPAVAVDIGMWLQTCLLMLTLDKALRRVHDVRYTDRQWLPSLAHVMRQIVSAMATGFAAEVCLEYMDAYDLWARLGCAIVSGALAWYVSLAIVRDGDLSTIVAGFFRY
ncbi:MAG: murein biosynthesis integral membrane protein MurJ [Desulfovibrio sp.]|nr:murein biosynthesis integral membrane protein MurJ [Desulfovibrio sp.]